MTKPKRKIIGLIALVLSLAVIAVLVCSAIFSSNPYYKNHSKYRQSLGLLTYETLRCKSSDEDEAEMQPILDKVGEAFAYLGTKKDSPIQSPYSILCYYKDENPDQVSVDYQINFVTVQKFLSRGNLWFEYKHKYYDKDSNLLQASGSADIGILCVAKIKKVQGQWVAYDIRQEP